MVQSFLPALETFSSNYRDKIEIKMEVQTKCDNSIEARIYLKVSFDRFKDGQIQ